MGNVAGLVEEAGKLSDAERTEFLAEFVAKRGVVPLAARDALDDRGIERGIGPLLSGRALSGQGP